jgi:hypothetical protein
MPNPKNGAKSAEKFPPSSSLAGFAVPTSTKRPCFSKKMLRPQRKRHWRPGYRVWTLKPTCIETRQPPCPRALSTRREDSRYRPLRQKSLLNLSACSKPQQAKGWLLTAAQNLRPHRQQFPPISGDSSSLVHWFLQRALTSRTIWPVGGKRSSFALTMANSSSVGAMSPTSPEPVARRP